jgi:hypothetical protein
MLNDLRPLAEGFWSLFGLVQSFMQLFPGRLRSIVAYFIWIWFSYTSSYAYHHGRDILSATVCPIPALGSRLVFCKTALSPPARINMSKMISSQDGLAVVRDGLEQNQNLVEQILDKQFAVRDLKIRVGASELPRKKELAEDLEKLIVLTKETSW